MLVRVRRGRDLPGTGAAGPATEADRGSKRKNRLASRFDLPTRYREWPAAVFRGGCNRPRSTLQAPLRGRVVFIRTVDAPANARGKGGGRGCVAFVRSSHRSAQASCRRESDSSTSTYSLAAEGRGTVSPFSRIPSRWKAMASRTSWSVSSRVPRPRHTRAGLARVPVTCCGGLDKDQVTHHSLHQGFASPAREECFSPSWGPDPARAFRLWSPSPADGVMVLTVAPRRPHDEPAVAFDKPDDVPHFERHGE